MKVEKYLDSFFRYRGWSIKKTSYRQHRILHLGDRVFSKEGKRYFVEYKSGIQTFYTGNIFLETVSVDRAGKPGWVYTCKADYLFYATLLNEMILVFEPDKLRLVIDQLGRVFQEKSTNHQQNKGYNTSGILVPLEYAKNNLASKIISTK